MKQIHIRQAQEFEAEIVSSILEEARDWRIRKGSPMWTSVNLSPESIRFEMITDQYWIAEVEGLPMGCLRFQLEDRLFWPDKASNESAFVHRLAVRRLAAGGQLSRDLIEWAKTRAQLLGKRYLRLDCDATSPKLCQFYASCGFHKVDKYVVDGLHSARFEHLLETQLSKSLS